MKTQTKQTLGDIRQIPRLLLKAFGIHWKTFLKIHIAVNIFSLVVLTPLATLLIGWLILASGQVALTDEEILFFALSPTGALIMLLVAALYATLLFFQQAAMITACHEVTSGRTISLIRIGRYLMAEIWPLFRLAVQMIGRTFLLAAPFLVACGLIYSTFLTEFDINYYLANKPSVFWWAGALILFCLLVMAGLLLRVFSGWVLALPLLLLKKGSPARVLRQSRKSSVTRRFTATLMLLVLFLVNAGMFAAASWLTQQSIDGVVAIAGESLQLTAYLLGGVAVAWGLANVAITFFANSMLSLFILYMFVRLIGHAGKKFPLDQPGFRNSRKVVLVPGFRLVIGAVVVSLIAGFGISVIMKGFDLEDRTVVMAHRGASASAPENTLAAIELAIKEGADWVEIDVQETSDSEVVVIHDSDLKKIGGSSLRVTDASLEALQKVDVGSWKDPSFSDQRIPTLHQVLALCKDRVNVVIELKYYGQEKQLEKRVVDIVEMAGMQDQIKVMSLSYPGIQKIKSLRPEWKVGLLSSIAIGDINQLELDFYAINAKFANRKFIRQAHRQKREVLVWTVNDPIDMSAMMSKGVDGIITDEPGLAVNIRKERAELDAHERMMIQLASYIGKQPSRPQQ